MGNEASKTRELWGNTIHEIVKGEGIDIGAGVDLISPTAVRFDLSDGDANKIDEIVTRKFDYVFSSHCLEHMRDPFDALNRWWKLIKPGGHLILIVPDEDLYEQGFWPSVFNDDHKWTFTANESSWSPVSVNIRQLVNTLPRAKIISIETQDKNYKRDLLFIKKRGVGTTKMLLRVSRKLNLFLSLFGLSIPQKTLKAVGIPIDQTSWSALAQIQVIVQKELLDTQ